MNASRQRSGRKRPILDAFYTASRISDVGFATLGAGFFGVRGAGKVGPFAAQQSCPLFGFGFFRRDRSKPRLTDFLSGFFGSDVSTGRSQQICVALFEMLFARKALKVFQPIIGLIAVYMMDLFGWVKIFHPAFRHNAVKKVFVAQRNVSVRSLIQRVGLQLSKNFSAARNSVQMVKESVFDSVDYYAGHVVPFGAVTSNLVLT